MTFPGDAITQYHNITNSKEETNFYQVLIDTLDETDTEKISLKTQNTTDTDQTQKHKG